MVVVLRPEGSEEPPEPPVDDEPEPDGEAVGDPDPTVTASFMPLPQ